MKRFIALTLVLVLCASLFAGCASKKASLEGTPAEIIEKIYAQQPVEFAPMTLSPDDPDYGSMWDWTYYTGLADGSQIAQAAVSEAMMGSIPFSLVVVRVNEGVDAKAVAEQMKSGIDTRKWICVEAGDLQVAGYGDVVMLIMVGEDLEGIASQNFVDAFKTVCGADLDFTI